MTLDGAEYSTEKDARRAIDLTVSQVDTGTGAANADAKFMDVCALYRADHLPTLEHSTRSTNGYLLTRYIEARFGYTAIRDVRPLDIDKWIKGLPLAATTKASSEAPLSLGTAFLVGRRAPGTQRVEA